MSVGVGGRDQTTVLSHTSGPGRPLQGPCAQAQAVLTGWTEMRVRFGAGR